MGAYYYAFLTSSWGLRVLDLTLKTNLGLPKGKRGWGGSDKLGAWDEHTHTTI